MNEYSRLSRTRREQEIKKKKKSKIRRIFLLIIFLLVLYGGYTLFNLFMNLNNGYKESENTVEVDPNFKQFSVLIMGIDQNDSRASEGQTRENSRTDSLIYLAINKENKRVDMVSIPRDSLSLMRNKEDKHKNSSYFFDKITHAHAYGGVDGTIESVHNLLNAPINFYVVINFKAFQKVVDSLGGIELYVPFDMVEQNSEGYPGTVKLKKGWQTLNGEEALAFSRSRYYDSDIERGQRQLQVLHATVDKAKGLNAISKINEFISITGDNVTHNMNTKQITSAASIFAKNDMQIVAHRIGGYDVNMGGVYYYYPKPSHLLYISSILNKALGNALPSSNDILNIHYQGYILPLTNQYSLGTKKPASTLYRPANYIRFAPEDMLQNIPERLNENDMNNDPTVSNENKPEKQQESN